MRFLHISDLHIGKRLNSFNLIEDQKYILNQILDIITKQCINAVVIAGDIYDTKIPTNEAIELFDTFISYISDINIPIYIISGNHDSAERLNFGSNVMAKSGTFIAGKFEGKCKKEIFQDDFGEVNIYMLPFIKPADVKHFFPNNEIDSYDTAIQTVLEAENVDTTKRNIIISHQYVCDHCSSEEVNFIGGLESVEYTRFKDFDYVALGHIHGFHRIGRDTVCYCGTPMKYSASEINHKKYAVIVELKEKNCIQINNIELFPLHNVRRVKGTLDELTDIDFYSKYNVNDYIYAVLTDNEIILDAVGKLRIIYPNIMNVVYENEHFSNSNVYDTSLEDDIIKKDEFEQFSDFFKLQNGNRELSPDETQILIGAINKAREEH